MIQLIVPFAGVLSDAGREAATTLMLPRLERLLARANPGARIEVDPRSLSAPHELVLARERGWPALPDGTLPWAADQARRDGIDVGDRPWGLLTPVHLALGSEQVALGDPDALQLDEAASRELFDAVAPLFHSVGVELRWGAPLRWYASHDSLAALPTASLDRVIGRPVDAWIPKSPAARLLRRLQSEAQMLLHDHPVNTRREASGLPAVNSLWLSGCGAAAADAHAAPCVDARLRTSALAENWVDWREAWHTLDAGPIAELMAAPPDARLTLAGERAAVTFVLGGAPWWRRWRSAAVTPLLHSL